MDGKRHLDGILIFDKPAGVTSNTALQKVKRLFKACKAGHSGSLDPIASGLLAICFGKGTDFSRFLLDADKHYQLTAVLGVRTDTGDLEGQVIRQSPVPVLSEATIEAALEQWRGPKQQIPPMYSAIKYQGEPLYKWARKGISIERQPRPIIIHSLKSISYEHAVLELEVKSSKGTYMRTLVDDIGELLGCGAHITALRRLGAGPYTIEHMVDLPTLERLEQEGGLDALDSRLLPLDTAVSAWPQVILSETTAYYLLQGQAVIVPYAPTEGWVRLYSKDQRFLGIGEILEDGRVAPRRLLLKEDISKMQRASNL